MAERFVEVGNFFKDAKGNIVQITGLAWHNRTNEEMVLFEDIFKKTPMVESLDIFLSELNPVEESKEKQMYRFEYLSNEDLKVKMA